MQTKSHLECGDLGLQLPVLFILLVADLKKLGVGSLLRLKLREGGGRVEV